MRFRAGLAIGFASGFYLGAMAGRERYEQINKAFGRIKRSESFDVATDKAKAVVDLGVERAKDMVETKFSRDSGNHRADPVEAGPLARTPGSPATGPPATKVGNGDSPH